MESDVRIFPKCGDCHSESAENCSKCVLEECQQLEKKTEGCLMALQALFVSKDKQETEDAE